MYDIIITHQNSNKKKLIAVIIILIIIIVLSTILGINVAENKYNSKYVKELAEESEKLENKKAEEALKEQQRQAEIQDRINKTSRVLTEEQENNILHIYKSTGEKRVFLTFDDGPSSTVTPMILNILKQYNVKATFFLLGINAAKNKDLIVREFNEGHYIANHGYSHKYLDIYASPEATLAEYNQTEQIIRDALGNQLYRSNLFRFPGGSNGGTYDEQKQASKAYLKENGIVHLDWNALSEDAAGTYTKEQLLENTKKYIGDNDSVVILMHDAYDKILTYEMLPDLIEYLLSNGYVFRNIYDLL